MQMAAPHDNGKTTATTRTTTGTIVRWENAFYNTSKQGHT